MTVATKRHKVLAAFGRTNERTGLSATEGDTSFTFDNTSNTINVGDHVLCSNGSDANIQYLGKCTADNGASGIDTRLVLQETSGALKLWEPTTFVPLQPARNAQVPIEDLGTVAHRLGDGKFTAKQIADVADSLTLGFVVKSDFDGTWQDWRTFLRTSRLAATGSFALSFFDLERQISRTIEVLADPVPQSITRVNRLVASFSHRFFIQNDDTYVDA